MDRTWRVVVRGPVGDEDLTRLPSDHMLWVSGHSGARGERSSTIWVRAADADSAREAVRAAIPTDGTVVLPADLLAFSVSMEVPEEDISSLERALRERRIETGTIGPLIMPGSEDAPAELLLDVNAQNARDAVDRAEAEYRDLRREADLPEADPILRTLYPPWPEVQRPAQARHRFLLQRANELLDQAVLDGAVVVAQSAVEVLVARVIGQRLQRQDLGPLRSYILSGVRKHNLNDDLTRVLWLALTGDTINQAEFWKRYKDHLTRRNAIVHRGGDVSDTDAAESVNVAETIIEHIEQLPVRTD